jgi:hypothetical protein
MTEFRVFDFDDIGNPDEHRKITAAPFVWRDPATIPARAWLYGRHYIRQFVSATVPPGGLAKTSLVIAEAIAMALKRPLLGIMPTEQTNVWI